MPNSIVKAENDPDWIRDQGAIEKLEEGTPAKRNEAIKQITSTLKALRDAADYDNARLFVIGNKWLEGLPDWEKAEYLSERAIYYKDIRFIDPNFLDEAIQDLKNIIQISSQDKYIEDKSYWLAKKSWATWWLIASHRLKGDFKDAHQILDIYIDQKKLDNNSNDQDKSYDIVYYNIIIERGLLHLIEKDYKQASRDFEIAYKNTKDSYAICWLIACHRLIGDSENLKIAENLFNQAPQKLKKEDHIKVEYAFLHLAANRYDDAIEIFSQILNNNPKYSLNEYAYQGWISALRLKKDFSGAKDTAIKALELLPRSGRILAELGLVLLDLNQLEEANFYFSQSYKISPNWSQLALCKVDTMIRINDLICAQDLMKKLRNEHMEDPIVREHLGWMYLRLNDMKAAEDEFLEVQRIRGIDDPSAQDGLGAVLFSKGAFKESENKFRQALAKENNKYYCIHLAWSLLKQGESAEIVRDYCRKALKQDPDFSAAFDCLGVTSLKEGSVGFENNNLNRDAENFLLKSIKINPVNGNYFDLGIMYLKRGQFGKSEAIFKAAIDINRYNAPAHFGLGLLYMHTKNILEAIQELQEAMTLEPNNENIIQTYALALMLNSEHNRAAMILSRAVESFNESKRLRLTFALSNIYAAEQYKVDSLHEDVLKTLNESQGQSNLTMERNDPAASGAGVIKSDLQEVFLEGIIRYKMREYSLALDRFKSVPEGNENYYDARRFAEKISSIINGRRNIKYAQIALAVPSIAIIILIWYLQYDRYNISVRTLTYLTPILLGLLAIAALLPWLARFKVWEIEAFLAQGEDSRTTGINKWALCIFSCVLLVAFWTSYYLSLSKSTSTNFKFNDDIIIVITPILLGLIALPILFSRLTQVKMPGLEAELRPLESAISSVSFEEIRLSFLPISFGTGRIQLSSLPPSISMEAAPP